MDKITQIQSLVKQLLGVCKAYYVDDKPSMTDKEYDNLYDKLTQLEQETGYILSTSPTQKVQGEVLPFLKKVQHSEPMLSAEKSKDINDVLKFMGNQECVLSWKLDGLTLVLIYNHGKFQQAITRGGGEEGEDVTHTVRTFMNIPTEINYKGYLEIRGEGLVLFNELKRINEEIISKGEEPYKTCRNLAAGSVRQLDSNIAKSRNLIFLAFGIVQSNIKIPTKKEQFEFLQNNGFEVVYSEIVDKVTIKKWIEVFQSMLPNLSFLTDGLIIEYNDIAYGKAQGSTGHHSKALFALKWSDDSYETTFRGVELNTTRTGMVSITGIFDVIDIDGVNVSRASLHNFDIFQSLELGIGDTIAVYRANQVIPQIEGNLTRSGTLEIDLKCPSCGEKIHIRQPKEARFLFCDNQKCPSKLVNKFVHFTSKNAMNIEGLSEATLEKFIDAGYLNTFTDIYCLEQYKNQIVKMEGFGKKSYEKLIQSIEKSKKVKLKNFIYALGIDQIGNGGAERLSKYFEGDWYAFEKALIENFDFSTLEDFGDITNNAIYKWYNDDNENTIWIGLINILDFINPEQNQTVVTDNIFNGKKVYATGSFVHYKKEEIKAVLESLGAVFASGYAKSLDYLIEGSLKSSSKVDKAKKDGVPVVSEEEFINLIR